jgi:hypothetical protein
MVKTPPASSEVLILGAGFSRAVSPALPLTDELGTLAISELGSSLKDANTGSRL